MLLIFWGFIMFDSNAILGHVPLVIGTIWSLLVGVDRPRRDGGPCFDVMGFHHVSVRCHTSAYPLSYWDHLEFVGSM